MSTKIQYYIYASAASEFKFSLNAVEGGLLSIFFPSIVKVSKKSFEYIEHKSENVINVWNTHQAKQIQWKRNKHNVMWICSLSRSL